MATLKTFSQASGLTLNLEKSSFFLLGPLHRNPPGFIRNYRITVSNGPITYLGIAFSHHDDFFYLNYAPELSRIKNLLNVWSIRDLTPIGKIVLIKTFAMSQLVYLLTVLPNPPINYFNELNTIFHNLILSKKPDKIKRTVLANQRDKDGLNMINIELFAKCLKCKWVKMLLDDRPSFWKLLFCHELREYGGKLLFDCNISKIDINVNNLFIRDVCNAWADSNFRPPVSDYSNQSILNNSYIKIDKNIVFSEILNKKNAHYIRNFFDENGSLLSYISFTTKFNITCNFPFTLYFGIIKAIPSSWKTNVTHVEKVNENIIRLICFTTSPRPNKLLYNYFRNGFVQRPTAIPKWEQICGRPVNWNRVFLLPFQAVRDTKIQYFQFRYIHRLVATNSFLYKIKQRESPLCTFCNTANESLAHLFWLCNITNSFWHGLFFRCLRQNVDLNEEVINFGYLDETKHPINFLLLHAKHFIYKCKLQNRLPIVSNFIHRFKFLLKVECFILKKNNRDVQALQLHETFWLG